MSESLMDNFLPGSASLVDCVDKRLLVVLRDGRKLMGWLRSYDQFANLVLQDTIERTFVADFYGDDYQGIFVVRGENVVLLGEVDDEKDFMVTSNFREVPVKEIKRMAKEEAERKRVREKIKTRILHNHGFSVDNAETNDHY